MEKEEEKGEEKRNYLKSEILNFWFSWISITNTKIAGMLTLRSTED